MEWLGSNSMYMMERSMNFLWTKQTAILDNIANAETPGYKAKYVTFEETLRERLRASAKGGESVSAFRDALERTQPQVHESKDESTRMDENSVNLTSEAVELSRNAYQLQFVMNSISSDFSTLRAAIRGQ